MKALAAALLLIPSVALAEPRTVTESATYILSDTDTRAAAENACIVKSARHAIEGSGVLITSESTLGAREGQPDTFTEQVRAWVGSVIHATLLEAEPSAGDDHWRLSCSVSITFDPDDISRRLERAADAAAARTDRTPGYAALPTSAETGARFDEWDRRAAKLRSGMTIDEAVAIMGPARFIDQGDYIRSLNYGGRWLWFGRAGLLIGVYPN